VSVDKLKHPSSAGPARLQERGSERADNHEVLIMLLAFNYSATFAGALVVTS
jgi:hypothetical protein